MRQALFASDMPMPSSSGSVSASAASCSAWPAQCDNVRTAKKQAGCMTDSLQFPAAVCDLIHP